MIERRIEVTTPEGEMPTFVFHPTHGGPHPVVLYLMDAPGIRPALVDMATRLASAGYYVMLPYLYYRGGPFREFGTSDEDMHARRDLMGSVTPGNIVGDAGGAVRRSRR
ncbi:dienelactone hydrolase family protein [Mycolicibacterium poriferae]|uniref:dienelactone hydrolase family protein n=1 Tax=Mycolicibacterium poriferae TaxID=39694 RepID=UPI0024BB81DC|nr:dienelactone hydrolase family protein [Mycolicibacterium poriferae]